MFPGAGRASPTRFDKRTMTCRRPALIPWEWHSHWPPPRPRTAARSCSASGNFLDSWNFPRALWAGSLSFVRQIVPATPPAAGRIGLRLRCAQECSWSLLAACCSAARLGAVTVQAEGLGMATVHEALRAHAVRSAGQCQWQCQCQCQWQCCSFSAGTSGTGLRVGVTVVGHSHAGARRMVAK